jgi:DNA-binding MarR family transcriptional regulator
LRRSQQVHTATWFEQFGAELTSPQYVVLAVLSVWPHIDQHQFSELASLDKSSTADVVRRLVQKHWVTRERDPADGRRNLLDLTPAATIAFEYLTPKAHGVQEALIAPVPEAERPGFLSALRTIARLDEDVVATSIARAHDVLHLGAPGHLIRCAQQVHTSMFGEEFDRELTGPQYAVLHILAHSPGINQRTLGERAALDKSTVADIVARLVARGWVLRERDPADRRGWVLLLPAGAADAIGQMAVRVAHVQDRLLAPLNPRERARFLQHLASVAFAGDVPASALAASA